MKHIARSVVRLCTRIQAAVRHCKMMKAMSRDSHRPVRLKNRSCLLLFNIDTIASILIQMSQSSIAPLSESRRGW
jgi:hypothetical protein